MTLKTLVKISNVTNLADARYCAGMGVEWLGFSMDTLSVEKFTEIKNWVAGVQIVGETQSDDVAEITQLIEKYQPDFLQVTHPELIPSLGSLNLPILLQLDFSAYTSEELASILAHNASIVEYFLIENSDPFAHLETAMVDLLDSWAFRYPILLGFGIKETNVNEVLKQVPVKGIALFGSEELRPGYNEFGELMDLLEVLETDD